VEAWSCRVAQDYGLLRIFDCPTYYHVKEDKLDPIVRQGVFVRFKKGVKSYKIWDPNDMKFILSKDVIFDEASMIKPADSHHVESKMTVRILQHVESDVTSPSLKKLVSFGIIPVVTRVVIIKPIKMLLLMMRIKDRL